MISSVAIGIEEYSSRNMSSRGNESASGSDQLNLTCLQLDEMVPCRYEYALKERVMNNEGDDDPKDEFFIGSFLSDEDHARILRAIGERDDVDHHEENGDDVHHEENGDNLLDRTVTDHEVGEQEDSRAIGERDDVDHHEENGDNLLDRTVADHEVREQEDSSEEYAEDPIDEVLNHFLEEYAEGRIDEVSTGLSDDTIRSLPVMRYASRSIQSGTNETTKKCVICLSDYEDRDELKTLPCKHSYLTKCITTWLKISKFCPICRNEVSTT